MNLDNNIKEDQLIKLNEHITVTSQDGKIFISGNDFFEISSISSETTDFVFRLQSGVTANDIKSLCESHREIYDFLRAKNMIHVAFSNDHPENRTLNYLANYMFNPVESYSRLSKKHVLILGLGGIGSVIFQHLLHNGVNTFTVLDSDTVRQQDFNRQYIYSMDSVGKLKTICAREYALRVNPDAVIKVENQYVKDEQSLCDLGKSGFDLVVNGLDTPINIGTIVGNYVIVNKYPLYDVGVGVCDGEYGPLFVPGVTACPRCFASALEQSYDVVEKMLRSIPKIPPLASFGPTNSAIGSLAALQCFQFLAGVEVDQIARQYYFEFNSSSSNVFEYAESCDCWGI